MENEKNTEVVEDKRNEPMPDITNLEQTLNGLTDVEVEESKGIFGTNALKPKKVASIWEMLLEALGDVCVKILILALVLKLVIFVIGLFVPQFHKDSDLIEIGSIFAAICLATGVSTVSEYRNTSRSSALQEEYSKTFAKLMRNGELVSVLTSDIVKGDIVLLQSGDKVPVDGMVIKGNIKVSQAALNGESRAEDKEATTNMENAYTDDFADANKIFMGSVVESGEAYMIATVLGDDSELGKINKELSNDDDRKDATSLKLEVLLGQINKLGMTCAVIAGILHIVMSFIKGSATFEVASIVFLLIEALMLVVTIIIMAVPEGLATVVSLVQSMNTENLYKSHILVSHKANYSDTAFMNILFSDKTGTITYGVLKLVEWLDGCGNIKNGATPELIEAITINNLSKVSDGKAIGSNNMDRALLNFALENGYNDNNNNPDNIEEISGFDSEKKCATVKMKDGSVYWKGATETIIDNVTHYTDGHEVKPFTAENRKSLEAAMKEQANRSMKLLSVAKITGDQTTLIAVLCCRDDVRSDAKETVNTLAKSGINVVMVTGDNKDTAIAIAKDADIYNEARGDVALTHDELSAMDDDTLKGILSKLRVVSRAKPLDKQRLVRIAQELGYVPGMTGDGVNDAPALKQADIGFAMGDGTAVAQEAGDVIILNNSLTSIKDCVLNSRTMAKSISKFLIFQLTINVATLIINILAPITGWVECLNIVEILYINLIMDTLCSLMVAGEPVLERYMNEKPARRDAKILTPYMKSAIGTAAVYITAGSLAILCFGTKIFGALGVAPDMITDERLKTAMFAFFIYAALFNGFNIRSEKFNLLEHITQNKRFIYILTALFISQTLIVQFGGKVFGTVHLTGKEFFFAFILGALIIPIDMIRKVIINSAKKNA